MNTTYEIQAGYLDSILNTRGERTGHASVAEALASLARAGGHDVEDLRHTEGSDGLLVYRSQEECDADSDGSSAFASIVAVLP